LTSLAINAPENATIVPPSKKKKALVFVTPKRENGIKKRKSREKLKKNKGNYHPISQYESGRIKREFRRKKKNSVPMPCPWKS